MFTVEDLRYLKIFPVVVDSDCQAISRVHPLKQSQIAKLYDAAKGNKYIKRIIIFGSSVTPKCHIDSDIDICLDLAIPLGPTDTIPDIGLRLFDILYDEYDVLYYSQLSEKFKRIIDTEGVVIYGEPVRTQ